MGKKITVTLFFLSCVALACCERNFEPLYQAKVGIINRMVQLMRTFYVKLDERMTSLHNVKFRYESSKEFEEGYLMAVIIEKYRQSVEQMKASEKFVTFKVFDVLLRLELVQRAYLDTYRLVNMMHEVPRKYGWDIRKRKRSTVKGNPEELQIAIKSLKRKEIIRKKKRRQRLRELMKVREDMALAGENLTMTRFSTRRPQKYWEYEEYGWELDDEYKLDW